MWKKGRAWAVCLALLLMTGCTYSATVTDGGTASAPGGTVSGTPSPQTTAAQKVRTEKKTTLWRAECEEFISLRAEPDTGAERLAQIPAGERVTLTGWSGKFAKVTYRGQEGYVLAHYLAAQNGEREKLAVLKATDRYSYEQMRADMETLRKAYPEKLRTESAGESQEGRELTVLLMGNPEAKHHVFLFGAIHGREHMTAWLLMAMAEYSLSEGLGQTEDILWHILPMSNPDGVTISQSGQLGKAQEAIYRRELESGGTDLPPALYAGTWKANSRGVDLNRNFPVAWQEQGGPGESSAQQYKGEAPFSEAESRALRDYTRRYAFDAVLNYHATGSILYGRYDGEREDLGEKTRSLTETVRALTGYDPVEDEGPAGPGYKDWALEEMGIPCLTVEIGSGRAPLTEKELDAVFERNCRTMAAVGEWVTDGTE